MKTGATILILALLTLGAGFLPSQTTKAGPPPRVEAEPINVTFGASAGAAECKCYCNGQNWSVGSIACMGGFKQRCVDRDGDGRNCGWATVKRGSDDVRCDGGEHCK